MPFIGKGPSLIDFEVTNEALTIVPSAQITDTTQVGTIYAPNDIIIIKPIDITSETVPMPDNIQTSYEIGPVVTDRIYDLLSIVMTKFSDPRNIEQNAIRTSILPYIDLLQKEIDKYPNVFGLIMDIQQVFKNITDTLKSQTNLSTNNFRQVVLPQLAYLYTLIAKIPVS